MIKNIVLIIGISCLGFNTCYSQQSKPYHDKYLIVLDVQQVFLAGTQMNSSAKEMVQQINSIIEVTAADKVIYIKATGKMLEISFRHIGVEPMPAPPLDSSLKVVNDHIFTKIQGDAFTSADLCKFLQDNQVKDIMLVGLLADKCIYDTAIGGVKRGYNILLVPEAVMGKNKESKQKAINKMAGKGVKILPIKEILQVP